MKFTEQTQETWIGKTVCAIISWASYKLRAKAICINRVQGLLSKVYGNQLVLKAVNYTKNVKWHKWNSAGGIKYS